jgi:hypothetical protein
MGHTYNFTLVDLSSDQPVSLVPSVPSVPSSRLETNPFGASTHTDVFPITIYMTHHGLT